MNDILPNHQQEIARLNYIIDLLIKENTQLKQLLQLSPQEVAPDNVVSSNPLQGNGQNHVFSSNPLEGIGLNHPVSSNPLQSDGQNYVHLSNPLQGNGQKNVHLSNPPEGSGQNKILLPDPLQGIASNTANEPVVPQEGKSVQYTLQDVQQKIIANAINGHAVLKKLRAERISAKGDSLDTSLKLLKHFALTPQNTHQALSKITGMSASGLAKHIALLKKKGYIARAKYQEYLLTQKALQLLGGC